ncbi:hypothetical protein [Streptomyces sp. SP18BB07]|uniref:hypothetical protein n=1 Tax=Streptomyces sp. SP18BB07 TaxID=3002522 RepID=UPI002E7953FC|nr:hypothetical protein [Streptomyces sp. SP18BB07]MEE1758066.1 hypothetical protein [Streptomyces sp. SP18BB07]
MRNPNCAIAVVREEIGKSALSGGGVFVQIFDGVRATSRVMRKSRGPVIGIAAILLLARMEDEIVEAGCFWLTQGALLVLVLLCFVVPWAGRKLVRESAEEERAKSRGKISPEIEEEIREEGRQEERAKVRADLPRQVARAVDEVLQGNDG